MKQSLRILFRWSDQDVVNLDVDRRLEDVQDEVGDVISLNIGKNFINNNGGSGGTA